MNKNLEYFLLSGFGCIAPNIGKYSVQLLRFGRIIESHSASKLGMALGALMLFTIGGIFVAFVMKPRDRSDAVYKGIAIPALLLALASGANPSYKAMAATGAVVEHTRAPSKIKKHKKISLLELIAPAEAFAAATTGKNTGSNPAPIAPLATQGSLRFIILNQNAGSLSVKLIRDGEMVFSAESKNTSFSLTYEPGVYTAILESDEYYLETNVAIQGGKETVKEVTLKDKSLVQKVSDGLTNLIER